MLRPQRTLTIILVLVLVFSLAWAISPFVANPTSVTDAYRSAGAFAPLVFLILVAVLPTPGAIIGASAVAYFGLGTAWLLLYIGNVLAVIITFAIVRRWGRPAVQRFLKPEKLAQADAFVSRHPVLLWVVYAVPIFPLELVTSVVALSDRPLRRFIVIPLLALPLDAFLVTGFGSVLVNAFGPVLEYASIAIVVVFAYGIAHLLYAWKRDEIADAGRRIRAAAETGVTRARDGVRKGVHDVETTVRATVRGGVERLPLRRRRANGTVTPGREDVDATVTPSPLAPTDIPAVPAARAPTRSRRSR